MSTDMFYVTVVFLCKKHAILCFYCFINHSFAHGLLAQVFILKFGEKAADPKLLIMTVVSELQDHSSLKEKKNLLSTTNGRRLYSKLE